MTKAEIFKVTQIAVQRVLDAATPLCMPNAEVDKALEDAPEDELWKIELTSAQFLELRQSYAELKAMILEQINREKNKSRLILLGPNNK